MCLLGQLPLILCSERIEHVYLSTSKHISNQKEAQEDKICMILLGSHSMSGEQENLHYVFTAM
jgi:hypothetical protein